MRFFVMLLAVVLVLPHHSLAGSKCPNGNGLYCGDPGKGQDPNHLYKCKDGKYTKKDSCSNGCKNNGAGKDDSCKSENKPTTKCPNGNGLYCGDPGKGQNPNHLYKCKDGNYSEKDSCNNGCQNNGAGKDDSCRPALPRPPDQPQIPPSGKCPNGNGLYCGDPGKGQDLNHLYQCNNGKYSEKSDCSNNGCQNNGAGKDDSCRPSLPKPPEQPSFPSGKCPSGNGLYCGDSSRGQDTNHLYQCKDGKYAENSSCSSGCQKNGAGKDDSCKALQNPFNPIAGFPSCKGIKDTHCASAKAGDQYQCTTYVQQNAGWIVGKLGTTLEQKKARINCKKPKVGAPGSVVVMSLGSYGHVGLVHKVNNNSITITDRNFCCDGRDRTYDISANDDRVLGFIVSNDKFCLSPETGTSTNNPSISSACPDGNGLYCGDASKGQDPNHLYQCKNGKYTEKSSCGNGCQSNGAGKDDSCKFLGNGSGDKTKPIVTSFDRTPITIKQGQTVSFNYSVSDSGGSGLKQVELWRSTNGKDWAELTGKRRNFALSPIVTSTPGSFSDNPTSPGTYMYGIHVVDNAGNWDSENGPKQVTVGAIPSGDKSKPVVSSFDRTPITIQQGQTVSINYGVSDTGGSGLKQVELWRSPNNRDWEEIKDKRRSLSGNFTSGTFSDTPPSTGTYYYGIHVVDNSGNWSSENGPKKITVNEGQIFSGDSVFIYPVSKIKISDGCYYGSKSCAKTGYYHTGTDFKDIGSRDIVAVNNGKVVYVEKMSKNDHGMGNNIIIEHKLSDGSILYSSYSHLDSISDEICKDKVVAKGDKIGTMGGSGYGRKNYWGVHLHFEIKNRPVTNNPSGTSLYWGYTPKNSNDYGYHDSASYIGKAEVMH